MKNLFYRIAPLVLAAALQVMPFLRSITPSAAQGLAPSAWSILLKIGAGATALLGGYDAVSGASVTILPPVNGGFTITLTNGIFYRLRLAETPYAAGSWTTNATPNTSTPYFTLFPGFSLTNLTGYLGGTATTTGVPYTNVSSIFVWGEGEEAADSVSANFTFIVLPTIPGSLTVTTGPPALVALAKSKTWNLDGFWQTNATTNVLINPGAHTVNFTNIYGWTTPTSQVVNITSGALTRLSVVYTQLFGGLQVNLQPAGPPLATGTWTIDGSPAYPSGTTTNIGETGTHTLTFRAVSGYTSPAPQTITVTNGFTNVVTAVYLSTTLGTVLVNLGPSGAVSAGAQWQLDGGPWLASGSATNCSLATHTISFASVPGWIAPTNQTVSVTGTGLISVTASYYGPISTPTITSAGLSGASLIISGTGAASAGYSILATNDLTIPLVSWPVINAGTINANGIFSYTGAVNTAAPATYYRVRSP